MRKKARMITMLLVMCVPSLLFAQSPPPFTGESPYGVTDVQVPFDDGVSLLVVAVIAYGLFRIWVYRKNQKTKKELAQDRIPV